MIKYLEKQHWIFCDKKDFLKAVKVLRRLGIDYNYNGLSNEYFDTPKECFTFLSTKKMFNVIYECFIDEGICADAI